MMGKPWQQELEGPHCIPNQKRKTKMCTLMLSSLSHLHSLGSSAQGMVLNTITMCLPTLINVITALLHRHGHRPISQLIVDSDTDHHKEIIM